MPPQLIRSSLYNARVLLAVLLVAGLSGPSFAKATAGSDDIGSIRVKSGARLGDLPPIAIALEDVELSEAIYQTAVQSEIPIFFTSDAPVWKEHVSFHGQIRPQEFLAKIAAEHGLMLRRTEQGDLLNVLDAEDPRLREMKFYELKGVLLLSAMRFDAAAKDRFEGEIKGVLVGKADGPRQPRPRVWYSAFINCLEVEATAEQHARLAEYLARVDRPAHRIAVVPCDANGRQLGFLLLTENAETSYSERVGIAGNEQGALYTQFRVRPTVVEQEGRTAIRFAGWTAVRTTLAARQPFDVTVYQEDKFTIYDQEHRPYYFRVKLAD
ncbi:MAG: hypothetical protein HZA32_16840 [Opitutae bacterium]|nr:hypothetical protein [Opitutae bacterium]